MKIVLVLLISAVPSISPAQLINAWTNATSSYWEFQTNWSLGSLPNQSQSVYITNAGFKAVAIGANTAQNFPASMQIQDLQIATPSDSLNVLLMNFSGFKVPLRTTSLSVGTNSSVVVLSSMLEVTNANQGNVFLQGNFQQGDFSQVKVHGLMQIRHLIQFVTDVVPPGAYFLTNGTLSVDGGIALGGFQGPGQFVQYGGSNNVGGVINGDPNNGGSITVSVEGEFDMYGGALTATNGIIVGFGDFATAATFHQYGGGVNANMLVNGIYILDGGTLTGRFTAPADTFQRVNASILQTAGTNSASSMDLGHPNRFGGGVIYTLSNGVVHVDSSTTFGGGWFYQDNGSHTIVSNLVMEGRNVGPGNVYAEYFLNGGTLSVGGDLLEQAASHFTQNGGTNLIAGTLLLGLTPPTQSTWYNLSGGTLSVKDIEIDAGTFFQHTSGNIVQSGVLLLDQGEWRAANGDYALGPLQLGAPNTNATGFLTNSAIVFPDGSSILRLASSSAQPWASSGILYINNWRGSLSGGGATQLYFGSNSSGLTLQQLSHIRFAFSNGLAPATLLASGELVPGARPTLQATRNGGTMNLSWPSGSFLQSATNVAGPYNDVSGATNPWPVSLTKPQEFFRLRQ